MDNESGQERLARFGAALKKLTEVSIEIRLSILDLTQLVSNTDADKIMALFEPGNHQKGFDEFNQYVTDTLLTLLEKIQDWKDLSLDYAGSAAQACIHGTETAPLLRRKLYEDLSDTSHVGALFIGIRMLEASTQERWNTDLAPAQLAIAEAALAIEAARSEVSKAYSAAADIIRPTLE